MKTLVCLACFCLLGLTACGDDDGSTDAGADVGLMDAGTDTAPADTGEPDVPADDVGADTAEVDTWTSFAMEWFATYCVECHQGRPADRRDYRTTDDVMRDFDRVRCGVSPDRPLEGCGAGSPAASQFPIGDGPFPDDDSRRRIVQWLDDGLME